MAKQYLSEHGIPYTELVFDDDQERQSMYDELGLIGSQRTVPQIFRATPDGDRERIGGYSDLLRYVGTQVAFNEEF
jgi:glutaredoxin